MAALPSKHLRQRLAHLVGPEVGQVAEPAEVDPEHRHVGRRGEAHHAQEGAVAPQAHRHGRAGQVDGAEVDLGTRLAHPVGPAEAAGCAPCRPRR